MNEFFAMLLNIFFPQPESVQRIENLTPGEFAASASLPLEQPPLNIYSLFNYKDHLVQQALWELKYHGNTRLAHMFAVLLYEAIIEQLSDEMLFSAFQDPILIPLPLSQQRMKERGWNQSEMLVHALQKLDKSSIFTINTRTLVKVRHTQTQTSLTRSERLKNLKGCFEIKDPARIANKNIILIDDVTTTGSTIQEAMTTLQEAGAQHIIAFTIAH